MFPTIILYTYAHFYNHLIKLKYFIIYIILYKNNAMIINISKTKKNTYN